MQKDKPMESPHYVYYYCGLLQASVSEAFLQQYQATSFDLKLFRSEHGWMERIWFLLSPQLCTNICHHFIPMLEFEHVQKCSRWEHDVGMAMRQLQLYSNLNFQEKNMFANKWFSSEVVYCLDQPAAFVIASKCFPECNRWILFLMFLDQQELAKDIAKISRWLNQTEYSDHYPMVYCSDNIESFINCCKWRGNQQRIRETMKTNLEKEYAYVLWKNMFFVNLQPVCLSTK